MSVVLKVEERAVRPRSIRKRLREEGRVPSAVHGHNVENITFSVDALELEKAIRENGLNAVYTLDLGGKKISTLLQDYQLDTFTKEWIHAEFLAVDMTQETEVEAELTLVGTPKGVKAGGVLEQNLYTVIVSATPDKLPERVEVDIEGLEIGDSLVIGDIPKQTDFVIVTDAEEQVCAVTEMVAKVEDEETGVAAEPEVINEKPAE
ncbi:50S ribosomal protein L25/general stress protein Ctc [Vagococcus carniphilus]|uniref:50S ribosomal protein L25/general stress protein Ctc n=1 Tax=Vagococcus carniphilus TaxID=218144 RepID=UPI0028900A34|nr:50S ribosomal protein L25/general stress protein Ctc [Vagococcus carniphilus]MDT2831651.1 50S ribosomal protein L25/general stress protein Ctc [Vagococcus carniphilus]MDT2840441.1 50S ribosomal protein L25/general stress protein Ctc [Vagococcus carniphilus]MDT2847860.1 50S ribosomal protein L25/general stress protein Ctc [Vagococcus carniphilus]MDT2855099.1 50S ribosomal protein L25/general stress protein Ctc [Vagococcus carniphilus]